MKLTQKIKLSDVKKDLVKSTTKHGRVVMGQHHGWTHDFKDCDSTQNIPLTRYGSPMMETNTSSYIEIAPIMACSHYGKYPVDTLMAMHFKNFEAPIEELTNLEAADFAKAVEEAIERGDWICETTDYINLKDL